MKRWKLNEDLDGHGVNGVWALMRYPELDSLVLFDLGS